MPKQRTVKRRKISIKELRKLASRAEKDIAAQAKQNVQDQASKDFEENILPTLEERLKGRVFRQMAYQRPVSISDEYLPVYFAKLQELLGNPFEIVNDPREVIIRW